MFKQSEKDHEIVASTWAFLSHSTLSLSYGNWPITDKGRQSLVDTHVEIWKLSVGGSWNSKTVGIGIKRNHKVQYIKYIKFCFYL